MLETYRPGETARSIKRTETHYQMAGWAVALRTMGHVVHEVDYLNAPLPGKNENPEFDIRRQRKHLFHLCARTMQDQHRFISLLEESCGYRDERYIITRNTGLIVQKKPERVEMVNPLVRRAATALFDDKLTNDRAILEQLDSEIKLVSDFYVADKRQTELLQSAKHDENPLVLSKAIQDIQSEAAFYIGYYERQREEGWS